MQFSPRVLYGMAGAVLGVLATLGVLALNAPQATIVPGDHSARMPAMPATAEHVTPATAAPLSPIQRGIANSSGPLREPESEFEQEAQRQKSYMQIDSIWRAEPVNPSWAAAHESQIADIVDEWIAGQAKDGLPTHLPDQFDAQCRSSICKITLGFADEHEADLMHMKFAMGLQGAIATANSFQTVRPDGGVQMLVYAGRTGPSR